MEQSNVVRVDGWMWEMMMHKEYKICTYNGNSLREYKDLERFTEGQRFT